MMKMNAQKTILAVLAVIVIAAVAAAAYYYRQYSTLKNNPAAASEEEVKGVVASVGKLMQLPNDETPSLATVLDKEKLKDQPFFKNAENGDKILAYTKAMKAILYRPSSGKIIEVAPLSIDAAAATETPATLKVSYYNGSGEAGKAVDAEKKVREANADYATVEVKDAAQDNYDKTIVIDISGKYADKAKELASLLGASVEALPEGESKPAADILIISGKE